MINFLRKIRRRILKPNNARKYILYAFGEIVLIVIGILIALQINNWNSKNKTQSLELDLLREIRIDFIADTTQLRNRYYHAYNDLIKSITVYDSIIKLDQKEINMKFLDSIFERCTRQRNTFFPRSGTFKSIVNNGNSNIFGNKYLFKEIQNIYDIFYQITLAEGTRLDDHAGQIKYKFNYIRALSDSARLKFYRDSSTRNEIEFWFKENDDFRRLIDRNKGYLNDIFPKIDDELSK